MKTCIVVCMMVFFVHSLLSQDIEPEEPGIVLPPMLLEVEDLRVEDIHAALPADEEQLTPEITVPLPAADELYLPEEVFDVPFPDMILTGQPGPQGTRPRIDGNLFSLKCFNNSFYKITRCFGRNPYRYCI